jgi:fatty acid desaturase
MENKLKSYIQMESERPPVITQAQIIETLDTRSKRFSVIMLSIAAALWTMLLYATAFWVGSEVSTYMATVMLFGITLGSISAGCFATIVIKFRKVGY